jgi:hypothetical protein
MNDPDSIKGRFPCDELITSYTEVLRSYWGHVNEIFQVGEENMVVL